MGKFLQHLLAAAALLIAAPAIADQSSVLSPGQTAVTSSTFTCQSSCQVTAYAPSAGIPVGVSIEIDRMASSTPVPAAGLNGKTPSALLGPGTYQAVRPLITSYGVNVGVVADIGAGTSGGPATQSGTWANQILDSGGTNKASVSAGGAVKVDGSGVTQPISAASLPLPSGAATAANQSTIITSLASILTAVTGVATAANQATMISSLASLVTNTTGLATAANQSTANTSLSSILTAIQAAQATVGAGKFGKTVGFGGDGTPSMSPTYTVYYEGYNAYGNLSTPTDMACLENAGSNYISIVNFSMQVGSTAATLEEVYFIKRSALDTGGTSSVPTPIKMRTSDSASTANFRIFTAAPSLGTAIGTWSAVSLPTAVLTATPTLYNMVANITAPTGTGGINKNFVLSPNEAICMNWNGASWIAGAVGRFNIEWVEYTYP